MLIGKDVEGSLVLVDIGNWFGWCGVVWGVGVGLVIGLFLLVLLVLVVFGVVIGVLVGIFVYYWIKIGLVDKIG